MFHTAAPPSPVTENNTNQKIKALKKSAVISSDL
jgi:hypothetical protein